jgi:hypothetical protein
MAALVAGARPARRYGRARWAAITLTFGPVTSRMDNIDPTPTASGGNAAGVVPSGVTYPGGPNVQLGLGALSGRR